MSLALNIPFARTNFCTITKNNSNAQQYKPQTGKQEFSKLKEIFQLLPNEASIDSRSSICSSSLRGFDDSASTVNSDSGFSGSEASVKTEKKRWLKVDDDLLHSDLKLFIQKFGIGFKSANEDNSRKNVRSGADYKKFFQQVTACGDENVGEINSKLEKLLVDPKTTDVVFILNKHFALLCDAIAHYQANKSFVEREVFKLPGSTDASDKGIVLDEPQNILGSVSKILDHLRMKMNVDAVEKFIDGMTVYCEQQQGMGIDDFEVSLKELILRFRGCAIDYSNVASAQNFDDFTQIIRKLASCIHSVSTRLWILSSLIKYD